MKLRKFQEGGAVPSGDQSQGQAQAQGGAPDQTQAPAQGQGSPEEQIAQMAQEIISQMGPEAAAMLAQTIMQMIQSVAQQGQPTYQRKGGRLVKVRG